MLEAIIDTPETTEDTPALQFDIPKPRSKTGWHGVSLSSKNGRYIAQVSLNGKTHYVGQYDTARQAAEMYDARAKQLLGTNAILNFPDDKAVASEPPARRRRKSSVETATTVVPHHEASLKTIDAMRQLLTIKKFLVSLTPEQHELLMEL